MTAEVAYRGRFSPTRVSRWNENFRCRERAMAMLKSGSFVWIVWVLFYKCGYAGCSYNAN